MQPSLIPAGHTSVMASRAEAPDALDFFPTPPWAARAGAEIIAALDPGPQRVWEPACGGGHMAYGLTDYFGPIFTSDIHDHGYADINLPGLDFLSAEAEDIGDFDWIVTNPPFVMGDAFVRAAHRRANRGVAMLLRLSFLEGGKRFELLYRDCPLSVVSPFAERVPMVKGRWDPEASSATAYAWFFWLKGVDGPARVLPIAPGARERLTKPDDARRFAEPASAPLFDLLQTPGEEEAA